MPLVALAGRTIIDARFNDTGGYSPTKLFLTLDGGERVVVEAVTVNYEMFSMHSAPCLTVRNADA